MTRSGSMPLNAHEQLEPSSPTAATSGIFTAPVCHAILIALFCLGLLLVIPSAAKVHGDEYFYTDAAIQMLNSGDYWTPHYQDGRIRLHKPILTYWAIAGSFQIFGVSFAAARLPFLIAGALLVCLTYQLAATVLHSRRDAFLAALIIASNVEVLTLSTRATPDILLCVFVLMSMWGFARVWFEDDRGLIGPLLAWSGMGLAVQTKGLLGLCPLAALALFLLVAKADATRLRRFLRWPAVATGITFAFFWYLLMLDWHGAPALRDFVDDQLAAKLSESPPKVLRNLATYFYSGFQFLLPWTLVLLAVLIWSPRQVAGYLKRHKLACVFLLSLFALLAIGMSFGSMRRPRYLAPSYPLLAVFLSAMLSGFATREDLQKWLRPVIVIVALIAAIAATLLLALGLRYDLRLIGGGAMLLAASIAGLIAARAADEMWRWLWTAGTVVTVFVIYGACVRPAFSPPPLAAVAHAIVQADRADARVYTFQLAPWHASQLRLLLGDKWTVSTLRSRKVSPDSTTPDFLLTTSPHQLVFEGAGYRLQEIRAVNPMLSEYPWLGELLPEESTAAYWLATMPLPAAS